MCRESLLFSPTTIRGKNALVDWKTLTFSCVCYVKYIPILIIGIRPYECRICEAVFTRQHSLNYHMLIHTNQTRFTCLDCDRKFRHPSHFKEHRRRHTGESPYECSDCLMRYFIHGFLFISSMMKKILYIYPCF